MSDNKLLKEFIDTIKDDYPDLTTHQLREICLYPFQFLAKLISEDYLSSFRIKYMGLFLVFPGKILGELKKLNSYATKSYCNPKTYWTKKVMILNYIKQNPLKFKKNEIKIKTILAKQKQTEITTGLHTR
jgi:hypothetical protein